MGDDHRIAIDRQLRGAQASDRCVHWRRCAIANLQQEGASFFYWHMPLSFQECPRIGGEIM
jgi:hypothetical protein